MSQSSSSHSHHSRRLSSGLTEVGRIPQELRVRDYELNGGRRPPTTIFESSPFRPFSPLRFLPVVSGPPFPPPPLNFGDPYSHIQSRTTVPLSPTSARRRTRIFTPPPSPSTKLSCNTPLVPSSSEISPSSPPDSPIKPKPRTGRVVDSEVVLDPARIPLPKTPPPPFTVPPTSIFTFKPIEDGVDGRLDSSRIRDTSSLAGGSIWSRSREQTLVDGDEEKQERSEKEMSREELALRMLVKVSEVSSFLVLLVASLD